jgi:hypothetical protein
MAMGIARLVPGVSDHRGAELAMQMLLTNLEERLTDRAKQDAQERERLLPKMRACRA